MLTLLFMECIRCTLFSTATASPTPTQPPIQTQSPTTTTTGPPPISGLSTGAIAGVVIVGIIDASLIVLIIIVIACLCWRKKNSPCECNYRVNMFSTHQNRGKWKADSHLKPNPGFLAWAASTLLLSYDHHKPWQSSIFTALVALRARTVYTRCSFSSPSSVPENEASTGGTEFFSWTPGNHSVCAIKSQPESSPHQRKLMVGTF